MATANQLLTARSLVQQTVTIVDAFKTTRRRVDQLVLCGRLLERASIWRSMAGALEPPASGQILQAADALEAGARAFIRGDGPGTSQRLQLAVDLVCAAHRETATPRS